MNENKIKFEFQQIERIKPAKMPRGMAISLGMARAKFIKYCSGINEDLLGPAEESKKPSDKGTDP